MRIEMYLDEDETATPIKIADVLITGTLLTTLELEEIAEHILIYCDKKHRKESED